MERATREPEHCSVTSEPLRDIVAIFNATPTFFFSVCACACSSFIVYLVVSPRHRQSERHFSRVSRARPCHVTHPSTENFCVSTAMRKIEPEFPRTRTIYGSNGPERWKFSRLLIFPIHPCHGCRCACARNPASKATRGREGDVKRGGDK